MIGNQLGSNNNSFHTSELQPVCRANRHSEIGQNPTGASLTSVVRGPVSLNENQSLVVEKVMCDILGCTSNPHDSSMWKQGLFYVGECGVGKGHIIRAIIAATVLVHRKE